MHIIFIVIFYCVQHLKKNIKNINVYNQNSKGLFSSLKNNSNISNITHILITNEYTFLFLVFYSKLI